MLLIAGLGVALLAVFLVVVVLVVLLVIVALVLLRRLLLLQLQSTLQIAASAQVVSIRNESPTQAADGVFQLAHLQ